MADPPDAVAISLERAPMMGRNIALAMRQRKKTLESKTGSLDLPQDLVRKKGVEGA
jgi:hypothetical protein